MTTTTSASSGTTMGRQRSEGLSCRSRGADTFCTLTRAQTNTTGLWVIGVQFCVSNTLTQGDNFSRNISLHPATSAPAEQRCDVMQVRRLLLLLLVALIEVVPVAAAKKMGAAAGARLPSAPPCAPPRQARPPWSPDAPAERLRVVCQAAPGPPDRHGWRKGPRATRRSPRGALQWGPGHLGRRVQTALCGRRVGPARPGSSGEAPLRVGGARPSRGRRRGPRPPAEVANQRAWSGMKLC